MKQITLTFLCIFLYGYAFAQLPADKSLIQQVLQEQTTAWNTGDLPKFMEGYWKSDSLQFIGKSGVIYGWKATLERYQKNYPDADSRGTLRFEILRIELMGKDVAFVTGKFHLNRPKVGDASGYFTLLWRKIKGKWFIVSDHTS